MEKITFRLNHNDVEVQVERNWTLLYVLREILNLTSVKPGCHTGDCGACKVIIEGEAVNSCLVRAVNVQGKSIETVEGLSLNGKLHPLQQAFIDCGAVQCGYCTPGMLMSAKPLLDKNPSPTEEEIKEAIGNNYCRCTGYYKIVEAIRQAAEMMREVKGE